MKVNAASYPHPVLGNEDDIDGEFNVVLSYELGKTDVLLNPEFILKNSEIENLLKKGKASFVVEVQCHGSFYRRSFSTRMTSDRFIIPAKLLRDRVTVGFFVCADEDIRGYRPSECHPDYDGRSFDVEQGDVLAMGGYRSFIADKDFDPMRPPVGSLFTVVLGKTQEGPMEVSYDEEKITIILSKSDHGQYLEVKKHNQAQGILHASMAFPVLVDAIYQMKKDEYENMGWYVRLQEILAANSLTDLEPIIAAQKILNNPLTRSNQGISGLLDVTEEKEYE